jgi:tRNA U38,U39,U40 pseudouridine synthase TruA
MLLVGRGQISVRQFEEILLGRDPARVNFNVPATGLFLERVRYPERFGLGM